MDLIKATKCLSAGLMLLVAATGPLSAQAEGARACDVLQKWALDNRAELPTDYAGLLAYEAAERRAIYGNLSAEDKVAVWRDRVAAYLGAHPELTSAQVDAISSAASSLRPEIFDWQKMGDEDPVAEVAREAQAALGSKIVRELFHSLGPSDPTVKGQVAGPGVSSLDGLCDCRTYNDCPDVSTNACLRVLGDPCELQTTGCGFWWIQVCYLQCVYVE